MLACEAELCKQQQTVHVRATLGGLALLSNSAFKFRASEGSGLW
jgi:hypothetical protein